MRRVLVILCIIGIFITLLSECYICSDKEVRPSAENQIIINEDKAAKQTSVGEEIIINTVYITEQPLSEIITDESDPFAKCYNYSSEPYIVCDNDVYSVFPGHGTEYYHYYENRGYIPAHIGVPQTEDFKIRIIIDNVLYGTEYVHSDRYSAPYASYITRYKNGVGERLTDDSVEGCYFAEEGIYYQSYNKIYLMDYNGENSRLIVEIPVELYVDSIPSNFIVYRGKLWYAYFDPFNQPAYPLWCYDFEGTFTRFDKGGLYAVNNGYLYYKVIVPDYYDRLYRFNCETYNAELIDYDIDLLSCSFCQNYILYNDYESLYRLDSSGSEIIILSADQIERGTGILGVSCNNNRIFVQYVDDCTDDPDACWDIEIDIDGNIIKPLG